ncbi:hypothetical protein [Thiomicrospira microaerophila]|uniref:hypothetical protein n=1 Tax=Thiomicrospira microaerophila TaxID=406020 RepID=UPI0012FD7596|nr:hypothetical protein [Thiomicrospira microaerophila]
MIESTGRLAGLVRSIGMIAPATPPKRVTTPAPTPAPAPIPIPTPARPQDNQTSHRLTLAGGIESTGRLAGLVELMR